MSKSFSNRLDNTLYEYRVRACNSYTWSCSEYSSSNTVRVEFVPSVPAKPGDINSTSTSYTVSWTKPSGTVNYYTLQERVVGGSWSTIESSTTSTSKTLSGKVNGTDYEYRVLACNSYSWSCSAYSSSNLVRVRLKPSVPAAPARPSTSTGSAVISWSKPAGLVSYYDLQKRLNNTGSWLTGSNGVTTTSSTLSGLTDGVWDFRVRACNDFSWACSNYSTESADSTVRVKPSTPSAPMAPSTSTGNAIVTWSSATNATYYDLQKRNNSGSWVTAKSGDTGISETLSGLTDGSWDFRIRACNGHSWACSEYSSASAKTTVRLRPSTPSKPNDVNSISTSYTVSWSKPSGTVTYYDLQERVAGGSWSTVAGPTAAISHSFSGKVNGTNYEYQVRACNGFSWSCSSYSPANSIKVRLKPSVPVAPTRPSTSTGSAVISWTKPAGLVSYYDLQKRLNNTGSWLTGSGGVTTTSNTLSGLTDGAWDFRVRACNEFSWACSDYSAESADSTVRIIPATPSVPIVPATSTGSATVSWGSVSGATYYDLEKRNRLGSWETAKSQAIGNSHSISGLTDGNWDFQVRACNEFSWACSSFSDASSKVVVWLKPSTPSKPDDINSTSSSFTVSWTKPAGTVTYYDLQERVAGGNWSMAATNTIGLSKVLSGKLDNTLYEYRVRACNEQFWSCSEYSAPNQVRVELKPSVPGKPTDINSTSTSYTVSWSKPSGSVSFYNLQERVNSGSWATVESNTTSLSKAFSSKADGSDYQYRVQACNSNSWACSDYSLANTVRVRLKPSAPSAPTSPSESTGSATISWTKPAGVVTYYDVEKRLNNTGSWLAGSNGVAALSSTLTNLTNGVWDFRVRACNEFSWACSAYSSESSDTIVRSIPSTPAEPIVPATSTGSAGVGWIAVTNATYYDVQKRLNSGSWETAKLGETNNSVTLSGLTDGRWDFRVKACNGNSSACSSYSAASLQVVVRSLPSTPVAPTSPATNTSGSYTISWAKPAGTVTVYDLQERKDNGAWTVIDSDTTSLNKTVSAKSSGNYDYRVRACNEFDWACTNYSSVSSDTQVRRIPATPSINQPAGSEMSSNSFVVAWNSIAKATYYELQQKVDSASWTTLAANETSTSFSVNVAANGTYEYRVKGCNEFSWSCSSYSAIKSISIVLSPDWASKTPTVVPDATFVEPTVPANEIVGAVEGSGGVSGGSASYSIPIAIAPGRAGMQPNVALSYSSRGGNGIVGVGWSLSAGGAISRCSATEAQDGYTAAPQYDATRDRLCLNGQRLMNVSGAYGASGTVYRTEIDSFARVTQSGNINSASSSFVVEYKNGRKAYFGTTSDSRHSADGVTEVMTWAIAKEEDPASNNITYHYAHRGEGEYTLNNIKYTGFNGSSGDRSVVFDYEDRNNDYRTFYTAGGKTRSTLRLKNIQTYYGVELIRQYNLSYGAKSLSSGRTLLRSVEECGYLESVAHCLPSTTFEWQEAAPKYVLEKVEFNDGGTTHAAHNAELIADIIPKADINGDGTKDWPAKDSNFDGVLDQQGFMVNAELGLKARHLEEFGGCFHKSLLSFNRTCMAADFNQDGKTDVFKIDDGNLLLRYTGTTQWIDTGIDLPHETEKVMSFTDYNGDGWPDIVTFEADVQWGSPRVYLYLNTLNSAAPYVANNGIYLTTLPIFTPPGTFGSNDFTRTIEEVGDMDGNGTPDLMISATLRNVQGMPRPYQLLLSQSQTNGGITFDTYEFSGFHGTNGFAVYGEAYFFHDINGDGLPDWINASAPKLSYKLNLGGTFESSWTDLDISLPTRDYAYELTIGEPNYYSLPNIEKTAMMDYNGDGKAELLYADSVVASACSRVTHYGHSGLTTEWMCDEELWGLAVKQSMTQIPEPIDGARKDVSARKYKAIYFDENVDGSITAKVKETDIIAAPVEKSVMDANGDGLVDMVTTFTCKLGVNNCQFNSDASDNGGSQQDASILGKTVYINRNIGASADAESYEITDVIKTVSNGLGFKNQWTYKPLSSDAFSTNLEAFYNADHDYTNSILNANDHNYFHFGSSMTVVAEHWESNGIGESLNATQYRYRGAVYNNQGRGFQGFRTVIMDGPTGVRAVTDFHQKFPLTGAVQRVKTCAKTPGDTNCSNGLLSDRNNGYYVVEPVTGSTYWPIAAKTTNQIYELNSGGWLSKSMSYVGLSNPGNDLSNLSLASSAYDSYGNILSSRSRLDTRYGVRASKTEYVYDSHDISNWWIDKLKTTKVTTAKLKGDSRSVYDASLDRNRVVITTVDSYDTNTRKPSEVTVKPGFGKGSVVETIYNGYGLPVSASSKNEAGSEARQITMTYSSDNYFVETITTDIGKKTVITDEKFGKPLVITDVNILDQTFEYDAFGRLQTTTREGVPDSHVRYAVCDNCDGIGKPDVVYKVTTYAAGSPQNTEYRDKLNRALLICTEVFNGSEVYAHVTYDDLGRKTFESVPSVSTSTVLGTRYTHDILGRTTSKTTDQTVDQSLHTEYEYGYGNNPHRTRIKVNGGEQYLYRFYNGAGQLVQTTDALGGITQYAYDGAGNPIVLQDANTKEIKATYNDLGQKLWVEDPNMGRTTFTYTDFGELDTKTDALGNMTDFDYDGLSRIRKREVSGPNENSISQFEYDNPTLASDKCLGFPSKEWKGNEFVRSYHYNNRCQLISTKTTIDGSDSFEVKTQYDSHYGRPKAIEYPSGLTVAYEYSNEGYLKRIYNAATNYTYQEVTAVDELGNWTHTNVAAANATFTRSFHPATGQMKDTEWLNASLSYQKLAYAYNEYGDLKQQTVINSANEVSTESYVYDDLHRLISTSRSIPGAPNTLDYFFAYDAVGNIKKKTDFSADSADAYSYNVEPRSATNGWAGPNAVRTVMLANGAGARTYNYDKNGNLVSDGIRAISYNAFNKPTQIEVTTGTINTALDTQPTSSSSASIFYGSDQMRYKKVKSLNDETTTHIYIDKIYERVVKTVSGATTTEHKSYVGDIAIVAEIVDGNAETSFEATYFHRDRLGSMTAELDELGNLRKSHSFDAFGRPRSENMSDKTPLQQLLGASTNRGFTDHEHLDESQLIHMNGRAYDYNLGRFLSVDPVIQEPGNSQSMNPYSYIMNNPLSGTDPSGYSAMKAQKVCFNASDFMCKSVVSGVPIVVKFETEESNGSTVTATKEPPSEVSKPSEINSPSEIASESPTEPTKVEEKPKEKPKTKEKKEPHGKVMRDNPRTEDEDKQIADLNEEIKAYEELRDLIVKQEKAMTQTLRDDMDEQKMDVLSDSTLRDVELPDPLDVPFFMERALMLTMEFTFDERVKGMLYEVRKGIEENHIRPLIDKRLELNSIISDLKAKKREIAGRSLERYKQRRKERGKRIQEKLDRILKRKNKSN
nr:fibronectin type III domain-containing protein [Pleionea sp. CnH1-48]